MSACSTWPRDVFTMFAECRSIDLPRRVRDAMAPRRRSAITPDKRVLIAGGPARSHSSLVSFEPDPIPLIRPA